MLRFFTLLSLCLCCTYITACSSNKEPKPRALVEVGTTPEFVLLDQAKESYDRGLYELSLKAWTELRDSHPGSYFSALAELKIADSYFFSRRFDEAAVSYEQFVNIYRGNEATSYALFQIAESHLAQYSGPLRDQSPLRTAIEAYKKLLKTHPQSDYSFLAKKRLRQTKEHLANHVAAVAEFYLKRELFTPSIGRLSQLANEYGDTQAARKRGEQLLAAYREADGIEEEQLANAEKILASIEPEIIEDSAPLQLAALRKSEEPVTKTRSPKVKKNTNGKRVIQKVDCTEDENSLVFVMHSNTALSSPEKLPSTTNKQFVSRVKFLSKATKLNQDTETQSCSLAGVEATFTKTKTGIDLEISNADSEKRPVIFSLDRPSRLVAIVPGNSNPN